jgi:hypothetical protein
MGVQLVKLRSRLGGGSGRRDDLATLAALRGRRLRIRLVPELCGASTLNPMNTAWMFTGDWRQHWLGFLFFQREPWTFPLGGLSSLLYPIGTNIGFTDSNPLLAILVKPFAGVLPAEYQLIGWWLASCFVLQGYAGAALASAITKNAGQQMSAGSCSSLSPVLFIRLGHDTLCAQWVLLALLYFGVREFQDSFAKPARAVDRPGARDVRGRGASVSRGHDVRAGAGRADPLLGAHGSSRFRAPVVWMIASTLGLLASLGRDRYFGKTPDGSGGFGTYAADLLTLFDPTDHSRLIPRLGTFGGEWEGIGFLGAGGLIALGIALVALVRRRPTWRPGTGLIVGACVLLGVYALSSSIHFVGEEVLNVQWLYEPVMSLIKPFRSSGRFIWPVHYLALAFGFWGVTRIFGRTQTGRARCSLPRCHPSGVGCAHRSVVDRTEYGAADLRGES